MQGVEAHALDFVGRNRHIMPTAVRHQSSRNDDDQERTSEDVICQAVWWIPREDPWSQEYRGEMTRPPAPVHTLLHCIPSTR